MRESGIETKGDRVGWMVTWEIAGMSTASVEFKGRGVVVREEGGETRSYKVRRGEGNLEGGKSKSRRLGFLVGFGNTDCDTDDDSNDDD